jgi:hypothetical protein
MRGASEDHFNQPVMLLEPLTHLLWLAHVSRSEICFESSEGESKATERSVNAKLVTCRGKQRHWFEVVSRVDAILLLDLREEVLIVSDDIRAMLIVH